MQLLAIDGDCIANGTADSEKTCQCSPKVAQVPNFADAAPMVDVVKIVVLVWILLKWATTLAFFERLEFFNF